MKCPECICNNSIIKMENYRVKFSECCHHHQKTIIFDEYENSQKIDSATQMDAEGFNLNT